MTTANNTSSTSTITISAQGVATVLYFEGPNDPVRFLQLVELESRIEERERLISCLRKSVKATTEARDRLAKKMRTSRKIRDIFGFVDFRHPEREVAMRSTEEQDELLWYLTQTMTEMVKRYVKQFTYLNTLAKYYDEKVISGKIEKNGMGARDYIELYYRMVKAFAEAQELIADGGQS